ncbi:non-canonical purine NTP pyrophosphatase [Candidatus Berkelbacteria bacterium]|uniref:Non-canonical purine NTP pyrophosphatase n=1 Tax=Candidatus Berkelbacteria bacterium CG10_big_fil_rev_8_21_14_0_10_43_14 TaxID=1974515 RepID=A0A2M6R9B2_9BACT|nr:non-canonical purine NTP pyrophosphatase [Candidatus Berkelbacteria bacterium]PIS06611.1 MAG: non-canonical purine NTP pyrophosphatase [Candidatus Berkelbacteria bacterium CG10_big_fil_rev_8_21_14_0_10_43_14]PIU87059.1 MAG: non-canonical purine NTP pyrophosphatase [Candidatus Berkelbacteria bacterium CG06_land_8_20_14_3_00_43_10]
MENKLYFITGNINKFKEVKAMIPDVEQLDIDLVEIQELDEHKVIEHKLLEAMSHHDGKFIVEDTSLYLDCLHGLPGPYIKWFLQTIGNDGLVDITKKFNNNRAYVKVIFGCARDSKTIKYFKGEVKGRIVPVRVKSGFGWDDIFVPSGYTQTYAQMGKEEKNKISMRTIALTKLKEFLNQEKNKYNNKGDGN